MKSRSNNCRGSVEHGTGCGLCGKCYSELARLKRESREDVTDRDINQWEEAATDPQHLEIIRLARVGLWAERHSLEIDDALRVAVTALPPARARMITEALRVRPKR